MTQKQGYTRHAYITLFLLWVEEANLTWVDGLFLYFELPLAHWYISLSAACQTEGMCRGSLEWCVCFNLCINAAPGILKGPVRLGSVPIK